MKAKIAIVGAGFAGLSLASYLQDQGWSISIFEAGAAAGGLAAGFRADHWRWPLEHFYHHLFSHDRQFHRWLKSMGIKTHFLRRQARSGLLFEGRVIPFDRPGHLWQLPHFSRWQKLRFGLGLAWLRLSPWFPGYEKNTVTKLPFFLGKKAFSEIWKPLLWAKFGPDDWQNISLSWFWARIKNRSRQLEYPEGGFAQLAKQIRQALEKKGVRFYFHHQLSRLRRRNGSWQLFFSNHSHYQSQQLVLALPLKTCLQLSRPWLEPRRYQNWQQIRSRAVINLILRLKKPLLPQNIYWLNILNPLFPFVGVIEHTNLVDYRYYHREHLVYLPSYREENSPLLRQRPASIFKQFAPWLRKIRLDFEDDLLGYHLFRAYQAQPITPRGYRRQRPPFQPGPPGLYWLNHHQIYPQDRGLNQTIINAQRLAKNIGSPKQK